ncbi:MAG: FMN-binding negative transcriptional regulator [Gammaproteobacteria bacterium]|nr:FMN-binding negative transcriptional regulator [Gammaproteobacteria bacterium]
MYVPAHFRADEAAAWRLMAAQPFGLVITSHADQPLVSHVPFLIDATARRVRWHLAAANPQVEQLRAAAAAKLVFLGPHAYVSPRWYAAPNVPTWNYAAVHVTGCLCALDAAATTALVATLTREYEGPDGLGPFEASAAYRNLLNAIRGFELTEVELTAKFKLSQNRPAADQAAVARELSASADPSARALGALMHEHSPSAG